MSFFDCVFLHRGVLETVTSLGSPRRPLPQHPKALFFWLFWVGFCSLPPPSISHCAWSVPEPGIAGLVPNRTGIPRGILPHPARAGPDPRWTGPVPEVAMETGTRPVDAAGQERTSGRALGRAVQTD